MDCEGWKVKFCKNDALPGYQLCNACRTRQHRERYPVKAAYDILRSNARERYIKFELTFAHWEQFCRLTNYIQLKGTGADDMTVDRIVPSKGYVDGNIQMLKNKDNIKKRFLDAKIKKILERDPDVPF